MNSARVAGGAAPAPLHSISLEPQSAVAQEPWLVESKLQPVRAKKRPDQPVEAWMARLEPGVSSKPVVSSGAEPELESAPGHTVLAHLLVKVKVVDSVKDCSSDNKSSSVRVGRR